LKKLPKRNSDNSTKGETKTAWVQRLPHTSFQQFCSDGGICPLFAYVPSRRFLYGVRREFMQRFFVVLHGTLGIILGMHYMRASLMHLLAFSSRGFRIVRFFSTLFASVLMGFHYPYYIQNDRSENGGT
jgi:hypothetical protein